MSRRYSRKASRSPRRVQQKANPLYAGYSTISDMPQPQTMRRDIKTYIEEGYEGNDTLFKVCNYGITNGAAIPPVLYTDPTKTKKIKSHAILDLLETPNMEMDGVFYRESVLGWFLLAGSSFMYANRVAKAGPPDELWILESNKVNPIPDKARGIIGYRYTDFDPGKDVIAPNLIGHMRSWNPRSPFFGLSPVTVAAILIDQQTAIRKWNLALLQNKGVPSGAWVTDVMLAPNDREKLEAKINEKMAGFRNAGKMPVLDGSLKWQPSAVNPSDLDWLEGVKYNAGGIANIFNMPPQLIGDTSSTTYDNMQEAKAASYTEYIFPMLDKFYSVLRRWLVPMYPDLKNTYLYYDKESVEVVQQVIQAQKNAASQRANQSYSQGAASTCTLNEAREMQGLPPDPQGDVYRVGSVLIPQSKLEEYAEQSMTKPAGPPMPAAEPLNVDPTQPGNNDANNQPANQPDNANDKPANADPSNPDKEKRMLRSTKALDLRTAEEKTNYANSFESAREKWYEQAEQDIAAYFEQERKAVVSALLSSSAKAALAGRAEGAINDNQSDLETVLTVLYQNVMLDIGSQVATQISGKKGAVRDFIAKLGKQQLEYLLTMAGTKVREICTKTLAKIRLELTDGVAQGESIPELAKRIDSLYLEQIIPNRSTVIARTEVVSSSNYASVTSAKQTAQENGLTLQKTWLSTEDDRTRPAHAEADGQTVDMDDSFDVGGEKLAYPGDPSGSPENVIQCRCTVIYKRAPQAETSDDSKWSRRTNYRKFMEEVLI